MTTKNALYYSQITQQLPKLTSRHTKTSKQTSPQGSTLMNHLTRLVVAFAILCILLLSNTFTQEIIVEPYIVNDSAAKITSQISPVVDCDNKGNFLVGWANNDCPPMTLGFRSLDKDHQVIGPVYKFAQILHKSCYWVSIASSTDNKFLLSWVANEGNRVLSQFFSHTMEKLSDTICAEYLPSPQPSIFYRPEYKSKVVNNDGSYCIVSGNKGQFISKNGTQGKPFTLGYIRSNRSLIQLNNGNFLVACEDTTTVNGEIFFCVHIKEFDSNGQILSSQKVNDSEKTSKLPFPHLYPTIAQSLNGGFIVAWQDYRNDSEYSDIYAQRFTADGLPQAPNFKVNSNSIKAIANFPAIASSPLGTIIIAWQDNRIEEKFNIFCQRFETDGSPIGTNTLVSTNTESDLKKFPAIASSNDGTYMIVWEGRRNSCVGSDIFKQSFNANGTPMGPNVRVSKETYPADQSFVSQGIDSQGNQVVVWQDNRYVADPYNQYQSNIFAQRVTKSGSKIGGNFRINSDSSIHSFCACPVVAVAQGGNFMIAWFNQDGDSYTLPSQIVVRLFDKFGAPLNDEYCITNNAVKTSGPILSSDVTGNISLAVDSSGLFVLSWAGQAKDSTININIQRFSQSGTPLGKVYEIPSAPQENNCCPTVAMHPMGSFIISWNTYKEISNIQCGRILAQRFDNNGVPIGEQFPLHSDQYFAQRSSSVAIHKSGKFVLCWTVQSSQSPSLTSTVYAQQFSPDGVPLGDQIVVADSTTNRNGISRVNYDVSGEFCIVWRHDHLDTHRPTLSGKKYTATGTPIGRQFSLHTNEVLPFKTVTTQYAFSIINKRIYTSWGVWVGVFMHGHYNDIYTNVINYNNPTDISKPYRSDFTKLLKIQNKPNPFSSATQIHFYIPQNGHVSLSVFSVTGKKIATLVNRRMTKGSHTFAWNGIDTMGRPVPSGIYTYKIESGDQVIARKMIVKR